MSVDPSEFYTPKVIDAQLTGMIKTVGENKYSARLKVPAGILTAGLLESLARLSRAYGRGEVYLTARLGVEIPGISGDRFPEISRALADAGVSLAGCGPRMRTTVACKGTVCPHGNLDTFQLAWEIERRFNDGAVLPHKFKVAVAGCASTCSKPQLNDVGLVGVAEPAVRAEACTGCSVCVEACHLDAVRIVDGKAVIDRAGCVACGDCAKACPLAAMDTPRTGLHLFAGGRWGRERQVGIRIAEFLAGEEALDAVGRIKAWYRDNGARKERLGQTVLRAGVGRFQAAVLGGLPREKWTRITPEAEAGFRVMR